MKHLTREQAVLQEEKMYYTGIPCINGHICERYTSNHICEECAKEYRKENPPLYQHYSEIHQQTQIIQQYIHI